MSDSPESVVREFYAAWADPKADVLGSFFADEAEWHDGPQGVRRGAAAIRDEITSQLTAVGGTTAEVKTLLSDGNTVMVEQVSHGTFRGKHIYTTVMAVFEFTADGRILQFREAYDLKSMLDQMKAAAQAGG
jgi:ketosteroid isomerase-like protein